MADLVEGGVAGGEGLDDTLHSGSELPKLHLAAAVHAQVRLHEERTLLHSHKHKEHGVRKT